MKLETFFEKFDQFAEAPNAVAKMRELILKLAVQGKLAPQDSQDEHAAFLVRRAVEVRKALVKVRIVRDETAIFLESNCGGELPSGWVMVPLGVYTAVIMGQSPPSSAYNQEKFGLPFYQGKAQFGSLYPVATDWCTEPTKVGEPDDVVISVRAPVGPTNMLQEKSCIGRGLAALRGLGGDQKYLLYVLRAFEKSIAALGVGSTFTAISKSDLDNLLVPLPPLAEQKRIVAKVDELMALCDRLEAQQQERSTRHAALARASLARFADAPTPANLNLLFHPSCAIAPADLRKTIFTLAIRGKLVSQDPNDQSATTLLQIIRAERLVAIKARRVSPVKVLPPVELDELAYDLRSGWALARLCELVMDIQTGPFGSSLHKSDYKLGGTPVINPASLKDGKIEAIEAMAIGPDTLKRLQVFKLTAGDIVMARRGEMGRCAVVTKREEGWLCGTGSLVLRMPNSLYTPYLAMLIGAPEAREYLGGASVGATMQNLNQSILARMPVGLPPLAEQRRIVAKVDQLMTLVDQLEMQLTASRAAATNLMEAAVAELTAQE